MESVGKDKTIFAIVFYIMFLLGWYIVSFGVLIPFYSAATHLDETHYSFTFVARSTAFILGCLTIRPLLGLCTKQTLILANLALISLSLLLCSLSYNSYNLAITLFISAFGIINLMVLCPTIILKTFTHNQPDRWLLAVGIGFAIGASLTPLLIQHLRFHTYQLLSLLFLLPLPLLSKISLPEIQDNSPADTSIPNHNLISRRSQLLICLLMFLLPAQEVGFAGWIPTYAIKAGVSSASDSAVYSSLFWSTNSAFRIIWVFLPLSATNKMKIVFLGLLTVSTLLTLLQHLELYQLLCITGPLLLGIMTSVLYGLCLTLSIDNGFSSTTSNNANFVLANCIGETLLTGPMGYSMKIFGFQSLIVIILVSCIASNLSFHHALKSLDTDKQEQQHSLLPNQIQPNKIRELQNR